MSVFLETKKVTIIGIGKLGLCTGLIFERKGYNVVGVDLFPDYCHLINSKKLQSKEPNVTEYLQKSSNLRATTSIDEGLEHSDLIFILVDTPTGVAEKSYDHSKLSRVLSQINDRKVKDKHLIISCTVLPSYISIVGKFLIQDCINTTLNYNPEFIAQGTIIKNFLNPDMVLIGEETKEAGDVLEYLYKSVVENQPAICRMSPSSAEITKLAVNCFITMKIAFCNTIGDIASNTPGADKHDVLRAVGQDSRVGTKCLMPGYGYGGPCFPRDNRALGWYAQSVGIEPFLPMATDKANKAHAVFMAEEMLRTNKDEYVFENVTYKDDCAVPLIEESQKLYVAKLIQQKGKRVKIRDRAEVIKEVMKEYGSTFEYEISK